MLNAISTPTCQPEVREEIEAFVVAVNSYPDRFARNPSLTFHQHLFSVVATQSAGKRPVERNSSAA